MFGLPDVEDKVCLWILPGFITRAEISFMTKSEEQCDHNDLTDVTLL